MLDSSPVWPLVFGKLYRVILYLIQAEYVRVGFLMRFWDSSSGIYYGWRVSILLEIIPALIFGGGLHWIPET